MKDLTNQRFGKIIALEPTNERNRNSIVWKCQCDCGNIIYRPASTIPRGYSCGCSFHEHQEQIIRHLDGMRFGRLTVIDRANENTKAGKARWNCVCDCGNKVTVIGASLLTGNTQSCGCLLRENIGNAVRSHGLSSSPVYHSMLNAKRRCENPTNKSYKNYGGRGIKFNFPSIEDAVKYGYEIGYAPGTTLDRIDTNGNYEPGNLRWVSRKTQQNNTRRNILIEYDGQTLTRTQWAE